MFPIRFNFMTKVTLMAVVLIILTASIMGLSIFSGARELLIEKQLLDLAADVELNGVRLVSGIDDIRDDTVFLSRLPSVHGIRRAIQAGGVDPLDLTTDALWRTQLIAIFSEMLASKPHYVQLQYISAEQAGLELVHVERSNEVIKAFGRRELRIDIAEEYFLQAQTLEEEQVYLSDIVLQRENGEIVDPQTIVMYSSTPIYSDDGSIFGVIVIGVDFGTVFDELLQLKKSSESIYVTNQSGDYLLNSVNPTQAFGFEVGNHYTIQQRFEELTPLFNPDNTLVELPASPDTNSDEVALHYIQVPFDPLFSDRYLGVAVSTPYSEIVGEIDNFINRGIAIATLLVTIGIIIAIFSGRILIRPLNQITAATQKVSDGQFDLHLPISSNDEFGHLASAFNQMAVAVQEREQNLNVQLTETDKARAQAEQSDQVKSSFLASMSHELRTPLNAVINFSKFIAQGDVGPVNKDQEDMLYEVVDSAQHLLNLINDVLDMSKIESGALNLFIVNDVNLQELIIKATSTAKILLTDKPVNLKTEIDDNLPLIRGDRQRITQILLNILSNACKFTQEGSIIIRAENKGNEIEISITDSGPGIAPEDHHAVFEAFNQTKSGIRQGGGSLSLETARATGF